MNGRGVLGCWWVPLLVVGRKMGAEEYNMKERIWMGRMEYSVLKEQMKENECGWSQRPRIASGPRQPLARVAFRGGRSRPSICDSTRARLERRLTRWGKEVQRTGVEGWKLVAGWFTATAWNNGEVLGASVPLRAAFFVVVIGCRIAKRTTGKLIRHALKKACPFFQLKT
jgi:hypothetical protein